MATHASLTGAELHEPKGVESATAGEVYVANGSGSGVWDLIDYRTVPAGWIVGTAFTKSNTEGTYTTTIPLDDTIPRNTEGTEVLNLAYTPKTSTSLLRIQASIFCNSGDFNYPMIGALFKDSDASALYTTIKPISYATYKEPTPMLFDFYEVSGSTSARTYKIRIGTEAGVTFGFNKSYNTQYFGNTIYSLLSITEIKQ